MEKTAHQIDERELEQRARRAYHRRFGDAAPIPSVDVDLDRGVIDLYNVNGKLARYDIGRGRYRTRISLARTYTKGGN
jgi:hypothetical protein